MLMYCEKAGHMPTNIMCPFDTVLILLCTSALLGPSQTSTLPEDWKDRIDSSVLESRESQIGLCDLDVETSVADGAFASAVQFTGKLTVQNFWPNGGKGIPYMISPQFDASAVRNIRRAMDTVSSRTQGCITFAMHTDQADYLHFRPSRACKSHVGKIIEGGRQDIHLSQDCIDVPGIIQHEILHALGLYHEQNRPDRDAYVDIFEANIKPEYRHNFIKLSEMEVYETFYDLNSLMHYGAFDFSTAARVNPTIVPKKTSSRQRKVDMGQRRQMSILDVAKIQKAYGCDFAEADESTTMATTTTEMTTSKAPLTTSPVSVNTTTTPSNTDEDSWLPVFSTNPMQQEQCELTFREKCGREHYSRDTCTETKGLEIDCKGLTVPELSEMVANLARPPMRPIRVDIEDGRETLTELMFRPIRRQVIGLELWSCESSRSTGKLVSLKLDQMLHLELVRCRDLDIKKGDFRNSRNLRVILFRDSTISQLEENTFKNLPKLGLLSLEYERRRDQRLPEDQKSFIKALHCGCHFKWLRKWFNRSPSLITGKRKGELYSVDGAFESPQIYHREIYRPFNCETNSVDFTLRDFSTPARLHLSHTACSS